MDDLISRQAAIALADMLKDSLSNDERIADTVIAHNVGILEYRTVLSLLPSEQPEIIRCKNCKYMTEHYDTDGNAPYWTCSEWDSGTDYDGFCHYAERRIDD